MHLSAADPRLTYYCPQPVEPSAGAVRLERFPQTAYRALNYQVGPLANLRSSSGCAVMLRTDSPTVELLLRGLRHHQLVPVGVACEVRAPNGGWRAYSSPDLREQQGAVRVLFGTGMERGEEPREVALWMPLISTCAFEGLTLAEGSRVEQTDPPEPRWLAIGDSLTQGFTVQCPTQNWVHRLMRRWDMPAWNLGVGGLKIEPPVVEWALRQRRWDLVTLGLGSNHAWSEEDVRTAPDRAAELAELALSGGHDRVAWLLPPWKPCEEGLGPRDFMGVPLNRETGDRVRRVRESIAERLAEYSPRLEVVGNLGPRNARYYPDGLHPFAPGFARYADDLHEALHGGRSAIETDPGGED